MSAPEADPRVTVAHFSRGRFSPPDEPAPVVIETIQASKFAGRPIPVRPWLVRDMIPLRTVTMLSGDGGAGKSLVAQQLAVAVATESEWLGTLPEAGSVVYVSAEDDEDEVHRRLADITASSDGIALADLGRLHIAVLAGKDAVLAMPDGRSEMTAATPLWAALVDKVRAIRPRLLIIDNLADAFAGNENSRPQARQFVGMLRGLAIECEMAVLIIAHPSLTGLSSGSGTSGSTAWSNSVRARLYLDRAKSDQGDEPDPDLRILRVMKANYAATGAEIRMRWQAGRFKIEAGGAGAFDRIALEAKAERVFLTILKRLAATGRYVSPNRGPTFAPSEFAKQPDRDGCTKEGLDRAMQRLLAAGKIRIESHGPASRSYSRIMINEEA